MTEIIIPYTPRPLQRALHELAETVRFLVCVCHRQFGKTVFAVNECLDTALFASQSYPRAAYIGPYRNQTKAVAWDYVKRFSAALPGTEFNEAELRVDFPETCGAGRIMLAGADNPDALRGMYFDLVVLDDYAFMEPRIWPEILRPTLSSRQARAIFIGTPFGPNHFQALFEQAAVTPEWGRVCYPASASGILSAEELASARATMTEGQYGQEYECSWQAITEGFIFGKEMAQADAEGRVGDVPWDPGHPVHTAWDLGIGASTAIWFLQRPGFFGATRLIDYYEASGAGLSHYVKVLREKPYTYSQHVAPRLPVDEGIDAVRRLLPQCWFDRAKCARGLEALRAYRRTWNEATRMFSERPLHDWSSHGCDAPRTFATGFQEVPTGPPKPIPVETAFEITMPRLGGMGW